MQVINIERDHVQKIRGATRYRIWFEHEDVTWFKYLEEQDVHDALTRDAFKLFLNSIIEDTIVRTRKHTKKSV